MAPTTSTRPATSGVRWLICGLLFAATVIAYIDRGILSFLEKYLEGVFGFSSVQYSWMTSTFQAAYGLAFLAAGRMADSLGIRRAFAVAIVIWSLAAMAPGAANSVFTFALAMFFLGIGEAANFPVCIKTVAQWYPKKERALATGVFNSGANIGNLLVPVIVPFLTETFTWRGAFFIGGSFGLVWLLFWWWIYAPPAEHKRVSAVELAHIQSDPPQKAVKIPWGRLFPKRETWAFAIGKLLTDPVWWFWTFWLPRYFQGTFHLTLGRSSAPLVVVFAGCSVGSIAGGWISGAMIGRGMSVNVARKTAMAICGVCALPVLYAPYAQNLWVVVALVALAGAAHQGFSANIFTVASDLFPQSALGSVVGIGGLAGAAAGAAAQLAIGRIVQFSYVPCFIYAGSSYLLAVLIVHLLSPKLEMTALD